MSRIFGYGRPTAALPDPDDHKRILADAGATMVFVETSLQSRTMRERRRLLGQIGPSDRLILQGLDRLGTSFDDALRCFELLVDRGVNVHLLDAHFSSGDDGQHAYRRLLSVLAAARSDLKRETIKQNLSAARAKGGKAPGKSVTLTEADWPEIRRKLETGTRESVAAELGVHRQTLWSFRRRMAALEESQHAAATTVPRRKSRAR